MLNVLILEASELCRVNDFFLDVGSLGLEESSGVVWFDTCNVIIQLKYWHYM